MSFGRVFGLTILAMIAFAGNSLLCRVALKYTTIDAASFTAIRLVSGAIMLFILMRVRRTSPAGAATGYRRWPCLPTPQDFRLPI